MKIFDKTIDAAVARSKVLLDTLKAMKITLEQVHLLHAAVHDIAILVKQHQEFINGVRNAMAVNAARTTAATRDGNTMEFPSIQPDKNTKSN